MTSATALHRVLPSFAAPISEFAGGYNDDCGPWAALAVLHALRSTPFDATHLDEIRNTMVAKGWWNWNNGRSAGCNVEQLNNYLTQVAGVHTTAYTTYGQGHPLDTVTLRTILQQRSGIDGIIIELAAAHNLPGNERNVNGHYIAVGGIASAHGYLIGNGDQAPFSGTYWVGWAGIEAAVPDGLIVVPASNEGEDPVGIPANWHDDTATGTLTAPNGIPIVKGFRDWILTHPWNAEDWPLAPEAGTPSVEPGNPSIGAGTRQDFRMTSLGWTTTRGVYRIWTGQDLRALESELAATQAQLANLQSQLANLHSSDPDVQAIKALAVALATVKS
jgi:hypothetical protein